jgi:hypothetical protein
MGNSNGIDYNALAKKYGAVSSDIDYDALAKKYGATSSPPANAGDGTTSDLSSALGSMARMYTGQKMATPEQEKEFQTGRAVGNVSGLATAAAPIATSSALTPIITKWGIKALQGAGLAAGYDLYHELKKVFEPK